MQTAETVLESAALNEGRSLLFSQLQVQIEARIYVISEEYAPGDLLVWFAASLLELFPLSLPFWTVIPFVVDKTKIASPL